ncbi:Transmembrane protein 62 [Taenia crassiceps]|uniref:Transmembrane protein 62 n=1 Tax=Taenia crassiceps TaxID=6207 RepID=A0ABR4Q1Q6_9CEST
MPQHKSGCSVGEPSSPPPFLPPFKSNTGFENQLKTSEFNICLPLVLCGLLPYLFSVVTDTGISYASDIGQYQRFTSRHCLRCPVPHLAALLSGTVHNVTLPDEMVLVPGASAYLMSVGEVVNHVAKVSFAFDTPPNQPVLLFTFRHFDLPLLSFNTREFCAEFACSLTNRNGDVISDIKASCQDNSNSDLYGPIVTVPEATNVTCSIVWYYPQDKSYLNGSIQMVFVSAYNGDCADAPSTWSNSSSWCSVELKSLVNADYEGIQPSLCLERTVAAEVFNTTCSNLTERPSSYSPLIYVVVFICSFAFLLIILTIICFSICKRIKRRKLRKPPVTAESYINGRLIDAAATSEGEEDPLSSDNSNPDEGPQGRGIGFTEWTGVTYLSDGCGTPTGLPPNLGWRDNLFATVGLFENNPLGGGTGEKTTGVGKETIDGKSLNCADTSSLALSSHFLISFTCIRSSCTKMASTELERVYDAWRRRDQAQYHKSVFNARIRTVTNDLSAKLETRRVKLCELFRREKAESMAACSAKLHAEETARKEAIIAEAAAIKEKIKSKNAEVAEREYQRLLHLSSDEFRLCRPQVYKREILKDQKAVNEFRRKQRAYENARDMILIHQHGGVSCQLIEADSIRGEDKKIRNKKHHDFLLQQIAEKEAKRKLEEANQLKNSKEIEEAIKVEAELEKQGTLQKIKAKQKIGEHLQSQMQAVKLKLKQEEDEDAAIEKAVNQHWRMKELPNADRRERLKGLNNDAKYFLEYQQQVRDHRRCSEAEADKQCNEFAEEYRCLQQERKKTRRCFVQQLNRETFEAHKVALDENSKRRAAVRAQKLEEETKNLLEDKHQEEEIRKASEMAVEAKRKALRLSLMNQLEEICLRRKQEVEEIEKEKQTQRLADENYQMKMKNLVCDEKIWDESHLSGQFYRPTVLVRSGDITDAKLPNMRGSRQFEVEWAAYERTVRKFCASQRTMWLDLRGNHDNFNVPSVFHPENYFRQYSVGGPNFTQSYMITHRKSFGTYSFIALDACPSPGIKRPFNFFGLITPELGRSLQSFSARVYGSNQTFWFGHYPTSTIISPGFDLRGLIGMTAYSYFCGHLHSLMNVVPNMYTVQPQGFLELELADWRDGRYFRIVAIDNDLVSFVDVRAHGNEAEEWPILLITNPKDAAFLLPNKEPTNRIFRSTHIRILAWSKYPITRVSVTVNGEYLGDAKPVALHEASNAANSPLFVLPWDPVALVKRGPPVGTSEHSIKVVCQDAHNNIRTVQQSFTLDGTTRWNFRGFQSFILLADQTSNLKVAFYLTWSFPFLALIIARLSGRTPFYGRVCEDFCQLEGLREVANCNVVFTGLICYLVYVLFGPIFMGYLLDDSFGYVFTFGVFVYNTFVPESTTYLVEIIQQLLFTYPLLLLLMQRMRTSRKLYCLGSFFRYCSTRKHCDLLLMFLLTTLQMTFVVLVVLLPYGWTAFCLSPGRLWLLGLAWSLFIYTGS